MSRKDDAPKPCPFCAAATVATELTCQDRLGVAVCEVCDAKGPPVVTGYDRRPEAPWRVKAVKAWNLRGEPQP